MHNFQFQSLLLYITVLSHNHVDNKIAASLHLGKATEFELWICRRVRGALRDKVRCIGATHSIVHIILSNKLYIFIILS